MLLRDMEPGDFFRTTLTGRVGTLRAKVADWGDGGPSLAVHWDDRESGAVYTVHPNLIVEPWPRHEEGVANQSSGNQAPGSLTSTQRP